MVMTHGKWTRKQEKTGNRGGLHQMTHGPKAGGLLGKEPAAHGVVGAGMSNLSPRRGGLPPNNMLQKESGKAEATTQTGMDGQMLRHNVLANPSKQPRLKRNGKNITYLIRNLMDR